MQRTNSKAVAPQSWKPALRNPRHASLANSIFQGCLGGRLKLVVMGVLTLPRKLASTTNQGYFLSSESPLLNINWHNMAFSWCHFGCKVFLVAVFSAYHSIISDSVCTYTCLLSESQHVEGKKLLLPSQRTREKTHFLAFRNDLKTKEIKAWFQSVIIKRALQTFPIMSPRSGSSTSNVRRKSQ